MPPLITRIPLTNPIRFVPYGEPLGDRFNTQPFDQLWYSEQRRPGQMAAPYYQKVKQNQKVTVQIAASTLSAGLYITDCNGLQLELLPPTATAVIPGDEISGTALVRYQWTFRFSDYILPDGFYYLKIEVAGVGIPNDIFISEKIYVRANHPGTLLFRYTHDLNEFDTIFNFPLYPQFEFLAEGAIKKLQPASTDTEYKDAGYDPHLLSSTPFRKWNLHISGNQGVPEWVIDRMNMIMSCSTWFADKVQYVKDEGAQWETTDTMTYPKLRGIITVLEADRQSQYTFRQKTIELFTIPPYSFMLASGQMNGAVTVPLTGTTTMDGISDINAWIALQNANPAFLGTFDVDSGIVRYTNDDDESFTSGTFVLLLKQVSISATATGSQNFAITFKGEYGIDYGDGTRVYDDVPVNTVVNHTLASGVHNIRVFHNDGITTWSVAGTPGAMVVNAYGGVMPSSVLFFTQINGDFSGGASLSVFQPFSRTMLQFNMAGNAIPSISGTLFPTSTPTVISPVNFLSFQNNSLSPANVDSIINNLVFFAPAGTGGALFLEGQTPPAPPTGTSAGALSYLTLSGWLVQTD